jgi:hypothetical protein
VWGNDFALPLHVPHPLTIGCIIGESTSPRYKVTEGSQAIALTANRKSLVPQADPPVLRSHFGSSHFPARGVA